METGGAGVGTGDGAGQGFAGLLTGIGRAFAGALLFGLPLLMTMEMWALGSTMDPLRLALLLVLAFPLLVGLSRTGGLRPTARLADDVADALVAVAVAAPAAFLLLLLFGALEPGSPPREIIGAVALQTVPSAIGAMLARNQLGGGNVAGPEQEEEEEDGPGGAGDGAGTPQGPEAGGSRDGGAETGERTGGKTGGQTGGRYANELFLMVAGALFLSMNIAPTEEITLIALRMNPREELGLLLLSLALMHGLVFSLEFRGAEAGRPGEGFWSLLARYTIVGHVLVLGVSLYLLWSFGRLADSGWEDVAGATVTLGFPGAIGAAVARLIL